MIHNECQAENFITITKTLFIYCSVLRPAYTHIGYEIINARHGLGSNDTLRLTEKAVHNLQHTHIFWVQQSKINFLAFTLMDRNRGRW
jgi:hypothetical protein